MKGEFKQLALDDCFPGCLLVDAGTVVFATRAYRFQFPGYDVFYEGIHGIQFGYTWTSKMHTIS